MDRLEFVYEHITSKCGAECPKCEYAMIDGYGGGWRCPVSAVYEMIDDIFNDTIKLEKVE